jgi:hypothetical protein
MDNRLARKSVFQSLRIEKHGRTRRLGRRRIGSQSVSEASVAGCSQCRRGCGVTNTSRTCGVPGYSGYKAPRSQGVRSHPALQASLAARRCRRSYL